MLPLPDASPTLKPVPSARVDEILAHRGISRDFIADTPLRPATCEGKSGVEIGVRLTSYRSLPLSCIAGIEIAIDGQRVAPSSLRLVIDGVVHDPASFGASSDVWWFIMDVARLFVPWPAPPASGRHTVEGTLMTVEPYMTAGRFTFYATASRQLELEGE